MSEVSDISICHYYSTRLNVCSQVPIPINIGNSTPCYILDIGTVEVFEFSVFSFPPRFSQTNAFDCGVYLINCAKILAFWQDITKLLVWGKMEEGEEDVKMGIAVNEDDAPQTTMAMSFDGTEVEGTGMKEAEEH